MEFLNLFINNLLTIPIFAFIFGLLASKTTLKLFLNEKASFFLTLFLLFSIGLKGGGSSVEHFSWKFSSILGFLVIWGIIQPFFSYLVLIRFTHIDAATAIALAACFGSVSVMTYVAATTFLEALQVYYHDLIAVALAIMEVPAIISGLFIAKFSNIFFEEREKNFFKETIFNKTILTILIGMLIGAVCSLFKWNGVLFLTSNFFKPILCLFLFNMGITIGKQREYLKQFSWSLILFGLYMPLVGATFGICLSYFFGLEAGTGTLVAVLTASASYIAVPAAMRIALPQAKEAIYLPLSLGVTFPFNVIIGIPVYYHVAIRILGVKSM